MCGIAGLISHEKIRENGERIKASIVLQNVRGNGLGAGFGVYGIFPDFKDCYAFQVMSSTTHQMQELTEYLNKHFTIQYQESIPTWKGKIKDYPVFHRFFLEPKKEMILYGLSGKNGDVKVDDYVIYHVMNINSKLEGSYVVSSGKNMGVFKGVGTPKDIYEFFCLDEYEGYCWIAHNRFPTNTPGWWGGAHPMNLLSWSIVHNGEISSYGINRRYLETGGYQCVLQTDSEVVAYLLDLLIRQHGLSIEDTAKVLAPNYWTEIKRIKNPTIRSKLIDLKNTYESAMLNGPFAILCAHDEGLFSLTDNTKLRPMCVGHKDAYTYFSSEVAGLFEMEDGLREVFTPRAGEPVIVNYNKHKAVTERQVS
ncbi:MAG: glutamine amidotransferase family protein [Bacillota bacterium]